MPRRSRIAVLGAMLVLAGCASTPPRPSPIEEDRVECGHTTFAAARAPDRAGVGPDAELPLSPRAAETARAIGVARWLADWARGGAPDPQARLERALLRQRISDRISLAGLEVASVLAELDCEGERIDQVRDRLDRRESRRLQRTTVASIVVGAGTIVGSGALSLAGQANAGNVVAILGGLIETAFGLSALDGADAATVVHRRNLLAEVATGPRDASALPPVIWRYLDAPSRADPARTNREVVLDEWASESQLGPPDSAVRARRAALLLGEGGAYRAEDLKAREAMLDQVEARIALFNRELAQLLREFLELGQGGE